MNLAFPLLLAYSSFLLLGLVSNAPRQAREAPDNPRRPTTRERDEIHLNILCQTFFSIVNNNVMLVRQVSKRVATVVNNKDTTVRQFKNAALYFS